MNVAEEILAFRVSTRVLRHNNRRWRAYTNRHRTTAGSAWGWIEGPDGHVTWNNDWGSSFTGADAAEAVRIHNQWLEDQKPPAVRLAELVPQRERLARTVKRLSRQVGERREELEALDQEIARLEVEVAVSRNSGAAAR